MQHNMKHLYLYLQFLDKKCSHKYEMGASSLTNLKLKGKFGVGGASDFRL